MKDLKIQNEKGVALIIVIVLSAVALAIMTALIYMITMETQISGLQKRYKTALEAGDGGGDVFYQLIATRAEGAGVASLAGDLTSLGVDFSTNTTSTNCTGLVSGSTASYSGLAAKLMTPSSSWSPECNSSASIDPATPSTYDMQVGLGTTTKYTVYAKIVSTIDGNTGGDQNLAAPGVENANGGEVKMMAIPFLYGVEVVSENSAKVDERAKLSILYQY
jgi:hypothetical protein